MVPFLYISYVVVGTYVHVNVGQAANAGCGLLDASVSVVLLLPAYVLSSGLSSLASPVCGETRAHSTFWLFVSLTLSLIPNAAPCDM